MRIAVFAAASLIVSGLVACLPTEPRDHGAGPGEGPKAVLAARALSSYFPPSEAGGGWRTMTDPAEVAAQGIDLPRLDSLGAYVASLPYETYYTGVKGYDARNKAVLVVKNGWLVGEYYNRTAARTGVYYLASNGKTFAVMLMGRMQQDYPGLGIGTGSRLYHKKWLGNGLPVSDTGKTGITFDQVFRHASGIIPQVQAPIADAAIETAAGWNFVPFTVGKDAEWPQSAKLYYPPGEPEAYPKGDTYSSVAFNHMSLVFRKVTGVEPSVYLRDGILDPIGVGRMDYRIVAGMGGYRWATAGNGLSSARDFARLGYLLLHEGHWDGHRIFPAEWLRQFITVPAYPNLRSNQDCHWGLDYPADLYSTVGSGFNRAIVVPSLDLLVTVNGRSPNRMADEIGREVLARLFASVLDPYTTCDGRPVNGDSLPRVTGFTLIDADTDQPIGPLEEGDILTLAELPTPRLNVRADTSPATVGKVVFGLDGNAGYRTEKGAPYALAGDDDGDYTAWTPEAGPHTLRATPYTTAGAEGVGLEIGFTVR